VPELQGYRSEGGVEMIINSPLTADLGSNDENTVTNAGDQA